MSYLNLYLCNLNTFTYSCFIMIKHKRVHLPLLKAIVGVLNTVFVDHKMADRAIQNELKSGKRWGSRDRAFIAKYSYHIVRWWRYLHHLNGSNFEDFTTSDIWNVLGVTLLEDGYQLPEIIEFESLNSASLKSIKMEANKVRKIRESIPDWLDEVGELELGEEWDEHLEALNNEARVGLRVNTLKTNVGTLRNDLAQIGIDTEPIEGVAQGLYLRERKNVFGSKMFKEGHFEVQDPGSQLISQMLDVKPGMRVVDACAGAGGKTLHLSALMNNKGTLIAMDVEEWKLKELKRRARRNGVHNIDPRVITNSKVIKRQRESADRLLLDVPCSGTGVLRRNPDAKWKLDQGFLDRVQKIQADILKSYPSMLKVGGKMVYATCSILPSENRMQLDQFLENNSNFKLIAERSTSPWKDGFDGFYMALLERIG